jgi:hypothetical protein
MTARTLMPIGTEQALEPVNSARCKVGGELLSKPSAWIRRDEQGTRSVPILTSTDAAAHLTQD